jgi:quercetin dioxygenase-like cupin family protein
MKSSLLGLTCLIAFQAHAFECETQFENEQICVAKVKIEAKEEIGLHRDAYPHIVIALKGGTITRLEADGRTTDVQFPTGVTITRDPDPKNELHGSINRSSEAIELVVIQLKDNAPVMKKETNSHNVALNIKLSCPPSDEFQQFIKSIPPAGNYSSSLTEWKSSFVNSMNQLIQLVESEKIFGSWWSVKTDATNPDD